ncbi:MAG: right-handed parallel beta-helix repeat-containing protein, partial [Thermoplasmata archaeon]
MSRRVISIWLSLVMVLSLIVIVEFTVDFSVNAEGTTLYVNTTGSGGAYTKIQDAIDNASDGDTVYVYNGTYYENVIVNKTLNLAGENQIATMINGSGSGDAVRIEADWVNITGFSVTGGGSGLRMENVLNCSVTEINASDNIYGIYLSGSSGNNITNNTASNNDYGLYLDSCNGNNITENNFSHNEKGMSSTGLYLYNSSNNLVSRNNILYNSRYGSCFTISHDNNISFNEALNNDYGIRIRLSNGNFIHKNNASENIEGISVY